MLPLLSPPFATKKPARKSCKLHGSWERKAWKGNVCYWVVKQTRWPTRHLSRAPGKYLSTNDIQKDGNVSLVIAWKTVQSCFKDDKRESVETINFKWQEKTTPAFKNSANIGKATYILSYFVCLLEWVANATLVAFSHPAKRAWAE